MEKTANMMYVSLAASARLEDDSYMLKPAGLGDHLELLFHKRPRTMGKVSFAHISSMLNELETVITVPSDNRMSCLSAHLERLFSNLGTGW
jgi:hypothetical protein